MNMRKMAAAVVVAGIALGGWQYDIMAKAKSAPAAPARTAVTCPLTVPGDEGYTVRYPSSSGDYRALRFPGSGDGYMSLHVPDPGSPYPSLAAASPVIGGGCDQA